MENFVIVRGGGDIATGTIYKLHKCGFKVLVLEVPNPSAIRRNVAFSEAVYEGQQTVEDLTCYLASDLNEAVQMLDEGKLAMLVDPKGESIQKLKPMAVVDAILAKKNLGTHKGMADIVIGLGPGFVASGCGVSGGSGSEVVVCDASVQNGLVSDVVSDVHAVIETMRGHSLGRVIYEGSAIANTGIPAVVGGYGIERVIKSPAAGILRTKKNIADVVKAGDVVAVFECKDVCDANTCAGAEGNLCDLVREIPAQEIPVLASIDGILRGMIRDGYPVTKGFKIADIDPRMEELNNCFTISDKARCIAGGVVEAIMHLRGVRDV